MSRRSCSKNNKIANQKKGAPRKFRASEKDLDTEPAKNWMAESGPKAPFHVGGEALINTRE